MPSNTPKTTYLNLPLYEVTDTETTFLDYWHTINLEGDGTRYDLSAFQLIDNAYHTLDVKVDELPDKVKSEIAKLFDEAMEEDY